VSEMKRYGRNQVDRATNGTNSTQILGPNAKRRALIVSGNNGTRISLSFGQDAVSDRGLVLQSGSKPVQVGPECAYPWICDPVNAVTSTGGQTVSVIEIFEI
jgi:hypothetical protein